MKLILEFVKRSDNKNTLLSDPDQSALPFFRFISNSDESFYTSYFRGVVSSAVVFSFTMRESNNKKPFKICQRLDQEADHYCFKLATYSNIEHIYPNEMEKRALEFLTYTYWGLLGQGVILDNEAHNSSIPSLVDDFEFSKIQPYIKEEKQRNDQVSPTSFISHNNDVVLPGKSYNGHFELSVSETQKETRYFAITLYAGQNRIKNIYVDKMMFMADYWDGNRYVSYGWNEGLYIDFCEQLLDESIFKLHLKANNKELPFKLFYYFKFATITRSTVEVKIHYSSPGFQLGIEQRGLTETLLGREAKLDLVQHYTDLKYKVEYTSISIDTSKYLFDSIKKEMEGVNTFVGSYKVPSLIDEDIVVFEELKTEAADLFTYTLVYVYLQFN